MTYKTKQELKKRNSTYTCTNELHKEGNKSTQTGKSSQVALRFLRQLMKMLEPGCSQNSSE